MQKKVGQKSFPQGFYRPVFMRNAKSSYWGFFNFFFVIMWYTHNIGHVLILYEFASFSLGALLFERKIAYILFEFCLFDRVISVSTELNQWDLWVQRKSSLPHPVRSLRDLTSELNHPKQSNSSKAIRL